LIYLWRKIVAYAALSISCTYDQDTTLRDLSSEETPYRRDIFNEDLM
jgi:hypothetical protein